jgi:hypothetical protein
LSIPWQSAADTNRHKPLPRAGNTISNARCQLSTIYLQVIVLSSAPATPAGTNLRGDRHARGDAGAPVFAPSPCVCPGCTAARRTYSAARSVRGEAAPGMPAGTRAIQFCCAALRMPRMHRGAVNLLRYPFCPFCPFCPFRCLYWKFDLWRIPIEVSFRQSQSRHKRQKENVKRKTNRES